MLTLFQSLNAGDMFFLKIQHFFQGLCVSCFFPQMELFNGLMCYITNQLHVMICPSKKKKQLIFARETFFRVIINDKISEQGFDVFLTRIVKFKAVN